MAMDRRGEAKGFASFALVACSSALLAACSAAPSKVASDKPTRSKEYFAESEYGVKASPRVSHLASNLPRGGGRDQTGKPYQVRGQWYHPRKDENYRSTGLASWYGDAFHGRLTANGEVYDKTHLTAAHPTMPLPSYARVTNKKNGSSVIVRVNDRGPFAKGRVIDLSQRAAELLDYKNSGVAQVAVEYVGRAPLHGLDDAYLMASYRPGGAAPQDDGLPAGVMIAMSGSTPTGPAPSAPAPQQAPSVSDPFHAMPAATGLPVLPDVAPIVPPRPSITLASSAIGGTGVLSYADQRVRAASAVESFDAHRLDPETIVTSFARTTAYEGTGEPEYVSAGTFASKAEALTAAANFTGLANTAVQADPSGQWYEVTLSAEDSASLDHLLQRAWSQGYRDAMLIRK